SSLVGSTTAFAIFRDCSSRAGQRQRAVRRRWLDQKRPSMAALFTSRPKLPMTFVVIDNCIKCKYTDCVEVCPVDAFHEGPNFLVIDPDECIDCTLCEPECPINAIYPEDDVPAGQEALVALNAELAKGWP